MRDELLAGMAWSHMRDVKLLMNELSTLMPRLVILSSRCDAEAAMTIDELTERAVEQTVRALHIELPASLVASVGSSSQESLDYSKGHS